MALMQEAVSKENWERIEKGLPPLKPKKIHKPEPERPTIKNEIKCSDIPQGYEVELEQARRKSVRNDQKVMFIGFDVTINLIPILKKRGPGRPKETEDAPLEPKTLSGWMIEGEFLTFVRTYRKKINQQVIHW
jgi:hypothetical protein